MAVIVVFCSTRSKEPVLDASRAVPEGRAYREGVTEGYSVIYDLHSHVHTGAH